MISNRILVVGYFICVDVECSIDLLRKRIFYVRS